eukprot:TRINITY_DN103593_c0_g1_i1.p1 TRINITY_DN103593_c0_g1~~TRINITY_DN103593_c0_g1_i1.p1  ORF type:complete len:286 (-),score=35.59 TRINITY_DN103593_c0_g1_i1:155-1012(-)
MAGTRPGSEKDAASRISSKEGSATASGDSMSLDGVMPRAISMDSRQAMLAQPVDGADQIPGSPKDVWVHIYHCDPYTGFLNRMALKNAEIGIYHAGVEVYGEEWSFQYFQDTWNDSSISGLVRCHPKHMSGYEYQESVNLGPTSLAIEEVDSLLLDMSEDWPANSYHLTRRNCLTFANQLSTRLKPQKEFPPWILGILEASNKRAPVDAVVDYCWSWAKWWMVRRYDQPHEETAEPTAAERHGDPGSSWLSMFQLQSTCGRGFCPGPVKQSTASPEDGNGIASKT